MSRKDFINSVYAGLDDMNTAKAELARALKAYKGSILMVCHEPEFYENLADQVWDCSRWSLKVV